MKLNNKRAFTLSELVVVVTILLILWSIAMLSIQWYSSNARDTVRLIDLWNIDKWIKLTGMQRWSLPLPDDNINIVLSGSIVNYKWYAWAKVLSDIWVFNWWRDPLNNNYYNYDTDLNLHSYELLSMLESGSLIKHEGNIK